MKGFIQARPGQHKLAANITGAMAVIVAGIIFYRTKQKPWVYLALIVIFFAFQWLGKNVVFRAAQTQTDEDPVAMDQSRANELAAQLADAKDQGDMAVAAEIEATLLEGGYEWTGRGEATYIGTGTQAFGSDFLG